MTQQEFKKEWNNESDFVVCNTSGSTGTPKMIKLQKEKMIESAIRTIEFFNITSDSRLHTCLDFKFIASKMMFVRACVADCRLSSEIPSNNPLKDVASDDEISLLSVVPSQMMGILDNTFRWNGLKNILIGGSPIPDLLRRKIALSGYNAWESYGMTETASHIALRKINENLVPFHTLPDITVSINEAGCLVVNMPNGEAIVTTDIAKILSDKEFFILGRADNCVISGGVKIIPEMLEDILGSFIAFNYCISSLPDNKWGEKVVLVVETGDANMNKLIIKKAVRLRLHQFRKELNLGVKSPKEVVCVEYLPRTISGKIDRTAVKNMISNSPNSWT